MHLSLQLVLLLVDGGPRCHEPVDAAVFHRACAAIETGIAQPFMYKHQQLLKGLGKAKPKTCSIPSIPPPTSFPTPSPPAPSPNTYSAYCHQFLAA